MFETSEKFWNFIYAISFLGIAFAIGYYVFQLGIDITNLKNKELVIISIASYRLTRLLIYDKVLNFFRDYFVKREHKSGLLNSTKYFLTCPWCAGIWMTLVILILFFIAPYGKFLVYILAISGIASFLHIGISLLGFTMESRKIRLKNLKVSQKDIKNED